MPNKRKILQNLNFSWQIFAKNTSRCCQKYYSGAKIVNEASVKFELEQALTNTLEVNMKKFFAEFKKFISRGNVMDMAVGMIIGAAFTAIVSALSDKILKPIINWVIYLACGNNPDALSKMYTPLVPVWELDAEGNQILDLTSSIYIDWGAFISAIINFLLVALVLFIIIKFFNAAREVSDNARKESPLSKDELKELKKQGKTRAQIAALEDARRAEIAEQERIAAEEAAKNAPKTQEQLLEEIADILRNK